MKLNKRLVKQNSMNGSYDRIISRLRSYVRTRYDLLRLELVEKSARIISVLAFILIGILLASGVVLYGSVVLVLSLSEYFGGYIIPLLLMMGVLILLFVLLYVLRERLVLNPLVKLLSGIILPEDFGQESELDKTINEEGSHE